MGLATVTLLALGLAAALGFLGVFLWTARRIDHDETAFAVVGSSAGSIVVIAVGLVEVVVLGRWSWLALAVGVFAAVGYPAWWLRMVQLR